MRKIWTEAPSATKKVTYIGVPLGLALAALGIAGDKGGWWEGWSYVTNLLSSLTGLCFAVPFALLILNYLAEPHAEAAQRRAAWRLAERTVAEYDATRERIQAMCRELAWLETADWTDDPVEVHNRMQPVIMNYWRDIRALHNTWEDLRDTVRPRLRENGAHLHLTMDPLKDYDRLVRRVYDEADQFLTNSSQNAALVPIAKDWYTTTVFMIGVRAYPLKDLTPSDSDS
ncbi:hypothetical protein [Streptomyces sp. DH12]|uniref:hypothetical protein n=1 Tax=Streptomyces sp. DH12 TaxID=2857010 RepID=UPI001E44F979|nr:hypothetical protein [Streptomyces sp. DH12]